MRNSPKYDDALLRIISLLSNLETAYITSHYGSVIWANLSQSCKSAIYEVTEKPTLHTLSIRGLVYAPLSIFDRHTLTNLHLENTSLDQNLASYRSTPKIILHHLHVLTNERDSPKHTGLTDLGVIAKHPEIFDLTRLHSYSVECSPEAGNDTSWTLPDNAQRILDVTAENLQKLSYKVPDKGEAHGRNHRRPFELSRLISLRSISLSGFVFTSVRKEEGLKATFTWITQCLLSLPHPELLLEVKLRASFSEGPYLVQNDFLAVQMKLLDRILAKTFVNLKVLQVGFDKVIGMDANALAILRRAVEGCFKLQTPGVLRYYVNAESRRLRY